jgi:hypothetical protein
MASPIRQRLLDLATDIATTQPDEMTFSHSVLCQFGEFFLAILPQIKAAYPAANFETDGHGMRLWQSAPPVMPRPVSFCPPTAGRVAMQRDQERAHWRFNGWQLDRRTRQLTYPNGVPVALTKGECALLAAFLAEPQRPLTREHLLQATRVHENVFDRSI